MLNRITLMGRLVADPEMRTTPSGVAVATLRLAVDRDFKNKQTGEKETDFINVVAWRQTAEFVSRYFTKGCRSVPIRIGTATSALPPRWWLTTSTLAIPSGMVRAAATRLLPPTIPPPPSPPAAMPPPPEATSSRNWPMTTATCRFENGPNLICKEVFRYGYG